MNMRHRITIKHDTSPDGEVDPTYTALRVNIPCNIVPVNGGERYRGKQLQAETNHVIETRYWSEIKPDMIAVNEVTNAEYTISRVLNHQGRDRMALIEATEVVV